MDEFDLIRRALGEEHEDADATQRAHDRLRTAIRAEEKERASRRRGKLWIAGVAACLAAVVIAVSIGLVNQPSAAAKELRRLAAIAASGADPQIGPGQFVLMRSEELRYDYRQEIGGAPSFTTIDRLSVQTWIAADGSGYRETTIDAVRFATAADREAWHAAGEPALAVPGDVQTERFKPEDAPWYDASALPSDPSQLEATLRADPALTNDGQIYDRIGSLLAQGDSSPELRAALFQVAADLKGITLLGTKSDPKGRTGTAIALDSNVERIELIFDPNSSQILAVDTYDLLPDGSVGPLMSWISYEPTEVVDQGPAQARTG